MRVQTFKIGFHQLSAWIGFGFFKIWNYLVYAWGELDPGPKISGDPDANFLPVLLEQINLHSNGSESVTSWKLQKSNFVGLQSQFRNRSAITVTQPFLSALRQNNSEVRLCSLRYLLSCRMSKNYDWGYAIGEQHLFRILWTWNCKLLKKIAIADMQLWSNNSFKSCWYAVAEVLPSSCRIAIA
jgi:hypothetical protein